MRMTTFKTAMQSLLRAVRDNPFFLKRVRSHLRGSRFYLLMFGYILLMCVVVGILYTVNVQNRPGWGYSAMASWGRSVFIGAMVTQALFVALIGSLLTATCIVSEREKQTFDLLRMTTASPAMLVAGEVLAAMGLLSLLLLASLPIIGLIFLIGGVSPSEFLLVYTALLLTAALLSTFGVLISALQEKANRALGNAIGGLILFGFVFSALYGSEATRLLACVIPLNLFSELIPGGWASFQVPFFQWNVSPLAPTLVLTPLAILLMGTLASRKLYDRQARALSTWQMSAVFYGILCCLIAGSWTKPLVGYINALLIMFFLLLVYILNQTTHPDSREILRLKRGRISRPDGFPLLGLHLVLANAAVAAWLFVQGVDIDHPTVLLSALVVTASLLGYWSVVRLMTFLTRDRSAAIRYGILIIILLLVLPVLVGGIGLQSSQPIGWEQRIPYEGFWRMAMMTNPVVALLELQSRMNRLTPPGQWQEFRAIVDPWVVCCGLHLALFSLFLACASVLQARRNGKLKSKQKAQRKEDSSVVLVS